jgi:ferredoxin-NADP reductase
MLASGVGITPLLGLLWELPHEPGQAVLIYRARTGADFLFRAELEALAAHRGVRLHLLPGRRADRPSWLPRDLARYSDAEVLRGCSPQIASHDVYVCGPGPWAAAAMAAAGASGVPADRIHHESFGW